ncbi:MAG: metallophosphoesterase [Bosea sp.]|jgi:Icc protein|nr:metallophosphoesterase [Bosea sp. (in: a-proteobacteria)]
MITRIAQISDTHLSPAKPWFRSNFDLVADHLRAHAPDMVINTGDLALDGADQEADLEEARAAHAGLGLECRAIPGNHDVGDHLDVARRQPVNAERLARYRRIVGPDAWSFDIPGWRLLGLNALTLGLDLDDGQQDTLVRDAARSLAGRSLAIFLHKPLMDVSHEESLTSNRFMTAGPRRHLAGLLGDASPALFCCGHVHQYRDTISAGSRHLWAPATSFMISDPWQPGYGAKMVGYLSHEFHADGSHRHEVVPVRGLIHHDLVSFPEAYGDVRAWGTGNA